MSDLLIARDGRAGRITLNRPQALNALTHEMCLAIEAALAAWRADDGVALVVIEGAGTRRRRPRRRCRDAAPVLA